MRLDDLEDAIDYLTRYNQQLIEMKDRATKENQDIRGFYNTLHDLLGEAVSDRRTYDYEARVKSAMDRIEETLRR